MAHASCVMAFTETPHENIAQSLRMIRRFGRAFNRNSPCYTDGAVMHMSAWQTEQQHDHGSLETEIAFPDPKKDAWTLA